MFRKIFYKYLVVVVIAFSSCSPTKSTFNNFTAPELKLEVIRTVALMKLNAEYLSGAEITSADKRFQKEIETKIKDIKFFDPETSSKTMKENNVEKVWDDFWNLYLSTGTIDETKLFDIAEVLKVNAVLQGQVVEVEKVYGEHRKTIGQTTAKMKYALFSLKSGKLLWEATVTGTQENAHSDQPVPKVLEAVDVAILNLVNELPFE